jgi:hypothetical protein
LQRRLEKEFPPAAGEIERSHAVNQERIVIAVVRSHKRSPTIPQELKRADVEFLHIDLNA